MLTLAKDESVINRVQTVVDRITKWSTHYFERMMAIMKVDMKLENVKLKHYCYFIKYADGTEGYSLDLLHPL